MNIFAVNNDPVLAAQQMCDKHVVKMPLESCQLLATCFSLERLAKPDVPRTKKGTPYKHFNPKHTSSIWTRSTRANFEWLIDHADALFEEKYFRYPKNGRHFSHDFFDWVVDHMDEAKIGSSSILEKFSLAIKEDTNCRQHPDFQDFDPVDKYRLYYLLDKGEIATWNKTRQPPKWWFDLREKYTL